MNEELKIYIGHSECYYDIIEEYIVHDSGFLSEYTCQCGNDTEITTLIKASFSKQIEQGKLLYQELKNNSVKYNANIIENIKTINDDIIELSVDVKYWLFLEIPWEFRKTWNLALSDKKIVLIKNTKLIEKGFRLSHKYAL